MQMLNYLEKRLEGHDRFIVMLDKRVRRIEKSQMKLRRAHERVYNWHYARSKRRTAQDKRMLATAKYWAVSLKKFSPMFNQLATVAAQIKKGRRMMLLSDREYRLLKFQLRGNTLSK